MIVVFIHKNPYFIRNTSLSLYRKYENTQSHYPGLNLSKKKSLENGFLHFVNITCETEILL